MGNHDDTSFVLMLFYFGEKYKLPNAAENVDNAPVLLFHFSDRVWKIKAPLPVVLIDYFSYLSL